MTAVSRRYGARARAWTRLPVLLWPLFAAAPGLAETLRVGVYDNPPMSMIGPDGGVRGLFPEVLAEIARREDLDLHYVPGTWEECRTRLERGEIDLLGAVAHSPERAARYDFVAETVISNWAQIYVRKGETVQSPLDLAGARLAVLDGDIHYVGTAGILPLMERFGVSVRFLVYESYEQALRAVERNEADAAVVNRLYGQSREETFDVSRTPVVFNPIEVRFALPRDRPGNTRLIAALDRHLAAMKADPGSVYHRALDRWFAPPRPDIPAHVWWALGGALALAALFAGVGVALRRQVRARTRELTRKNREMEHEIQVREWIEASLRGSERDARQSQQRIREILEAVPCAINIYDRDLRLTFWNRRYADFLRLSPETIREGMDVAALIRLGIGSGAIEPDSATDTDSWIAGRIGFLREFGPAPHRTLIRSGGCWWQVDRCRAADGGVLTIRTDVSELKARETAALRARESAELANRAKTEFLANMSHELRTPLNSIIGFAELLGTQILGPLGNPRYVGYAEDIRTSGHHLLTLIGDILDVSRIETGALDVRREPVEPGAVLAACVRMVTARARENGLELSMLGPAAAPRILVDPRHLKQVLLNLLGNAVKFTPGGGRVVAEITVAHDVAFHVRDTGVGIPPEDLGRILEPFVRGDDVMTRAAEGAGLGLYLARKLTEASGGTLAIESEPGVGTAVSVRFPPHAEKPSVEHSPGAGVQ